MEVLTGIVFHDFWSYGAVALAVWYPLAVTALMVWERCADYDGKFDNADRAGAAGIAFFLSLFWFVTVPVALCLRVGFRLADKGVPVLQTPKERADRRRQRELEPRSRMPEIAMSLDADGRPQSVEDVIGGAR